MPSLALLVQCLKIGVLDGTALHLEVPDSAAAVARAGLVTVALALFAAVGPGATSFATLASADSRLLAVMPHDSVELRDPGFLIANLFHELLVDRVDGWPLPPAPGLDYSHEEHFKGVVRAVLLRNGSMSSSSFWGSSPNMRAMRAVVSMVAPMRASCRCYKASHCIKASGKVAQLVALTGLITARVSARALLVLTGSNLAVRIRHISTPVQRSDSHTQLCAGGIVISLSSDLSSLSMTCVTW